MSNEVSELNYRLTSSVTSMSRNIDVSELLERQKDLRASLRKQGAIVNFKDHQVDIIDIYALSAVLLEEEFATVTSLCLEDNELEDEALAKLSEMLKVNKNIVDLDISDNKFSQRGVQYLFNALRSGEQTLRSLSLEDNTKIEGPGVAFLGQILETCTALETLNVSGIPLQSNLDAFLAGVKSSKTLRSLILENTRLDGEVMERFLDELCCETNECLLRELNLNYNQCDSFAVFQPLFTHEAFRKLKKLHLSYSSEQDYSGYKKRPVKLIFNYMKSNQTIEELYLKGNNFMNRDCHSLRSLLKLKSKLKILDLSDNNIEMTGATLLVNCLSTNTTLHHLVLVGNRFLEEKGGIELCQSIDDKLAPNRRIRNESASCITGKKSRVDRRISEKDRSDGSLPGRKKSRFPSGDRRSIDNKSDDGSFENKGSAPVKDETPRLQARQFEDNLSGGWQSVVNQTILPKSLGSKKFADNLSGAWSSVVHDNENIQKSKGTKQFADNLSGTWSSVVHEKPNHSKQFTDNLSGTWSSVVHDKENVQKSKGTNQFAANLDDDWESVVPTKVSLKGNNAVGVAKSHDKSKDNLGEDWESVIIHDKKKVNHSDYDNLNDEENSVVYQDDDDDFDSVVFESEGGSPVVRPQLLQKKESQKYFFNNKTEDDFSERSSAKTPDNWEYQEVTKSEMSYIAHVKQMYENKAFAESNPAAIIDLSPESIHILEAMLSEFENLLDREENVTSIRVGRKAKRNFVKKFGIIGQLNKQQPGKVFDYTLAKSVIDRTLISRQLVRNISLINQFAKLRRQIGSGVPTKLGGMLPSVYFQSVVNSSTKMISIEHLESFASSLLLIKVVVWSIFKAFTLSDPKVDPEGRKLLEEFGKAMIEIDNNSSDVPQYKKKSHNYIAEKRSQLGKYIITGAVRELINLLVLLRPMFAIAEALFVTVASSNPQPSLEHYENIHRYREKRSGKKLARKFEKVKLLNRAITQLDKLKKKRPTADKDEQQKIIGLKGEWKVNQLLNGVEKMQRKNQDTKVNKKRGSRISKRSLEKRIEISPDVILYRENCPERVNNVLSDIKVETQSLLTILSIEDFFPTMLSFCDYTNTVDHYQKTAQGVLESMQGWVKSLSNEFQAEILHHFAPSVTPEVASDMKPKENFMPRKEIKRIPKKKEPENELMAAFNRIKKKKKMSIPVDDVLKKPMKPEDESFFNPVLNNLFSWKKLTHGGALKIREVVQKKLEDKDQKRRHHFVDHLQNLCKNGCNKTISRLTLETRDRFANEFGV